MRVLINDFAGHPFQIQLSRELARAGHSVMHTYFAANNTPKGKLDSGNTVPNLQVEAISIGGTFKKHCVMSRRSADTHYGRELCERVRMFRPDVVASANTPLDAQDILLDLTRNMGVPLIFWLQDLLSIGNEFALRRKHVPFAGAIGWYYRRLEKRLVNQSDAIICIAPEFCEILQRWGVPSHRTFVIQNWAPLDEVIRMPTHHTAWAREQGIAGMTCLMYSGTLGMKHRPDLLLALAKHFESDESIVTVVVAQGVGADWLVAHLQEVRPGALKVLPFQPYERVSEMMASAHVLISLLEEECGAFAVPSKTLAYLCAGRPVLIASPRCNLAYRIVSEAKAGLAVEVTDLDRFVAAAEKLAYDDALREFYGRNGRQYAETHFVIDKIRDNFLQVLNFAHGRSASPAALVFPTDSIAAAA